LNRKLAALAISAGLGGMMGMGAVIQTVSHAASCPTQGTNSLPDNPAGVYADGDQAAATGHAGVAGAQGPVSGFAEVGNDTAAGPQVAAVGSIAGAPDTGGNGLVVNSGGPAQCS
jgi:hypothetical protein